MTPLAILPAAGLSRRMGRPKLLLEFGGSTIVGSLVRTLRAAGVERIVLVTAPQGEELRHWARESGIEAAINPTPDDGMLSTILAGLDAAGGEAALEKASTPLLVSPADLPRIKEVTVRRLLRAFGDCETDLAVPTYEGKHGHPLIIAPRRVAEIPSLDPSVGLRQLLERYPPLEVETDDDGVISDIDTPEDYERLRARVPKDPEPSRRGS